MKPILHIGPPKTATTSLQASVIPLLGRPYQIKPAWVRQLTRNPKFDPPLNLASNIIVSDERLGTFGVFSPTIIADRLAQIFNDAHVLFAARDTVDLFYSLYRQALLNRVALQGAAILYLGEWLLPLSADSIFDAWRADYNKTGSGFFASINLNSLRIAFERYFDFTVLDFEMLKTSPEAFVSGFTRECGSHVSPALVHVNETKLEMMEGRLEVCPPELPQFLRTQFSEFYQSSRLTPDRDQFLRDHQHRLNLHAFASSFQFRKR